MSAGVDVVLVWHMHQPDYRDPANGRFRLPWVLLHAIKDYADMAAHLEAQPGMRAVVNFVPVLLDQIDDYADQFATHQFRDPLLVALARPAERAFDEEERAFLLAQGFAANNERMITPFPAYARLRDLGRLAGQGDPGRYLADPFLDDLLVWYLLAWTGETVRRGSPLVRSLMDKGSGFTAADRHALLDALGAIVGALAGRYRALQTRGTLELSTSPAQHPIGPLLLDFACAREARPDLALPRSRAYPGGTERLALHIQEALNSHAHRFGRAPVGLWPSEGAVSDAFVHALSGHGFAWFASGSQVLEHSLARAGLAPSASQRHRGWRLASAVGMLGFFRDDRLSDLIGFEYRRWHSGDAVRHFLGELRSVGAASRDGRRPLVTIIVDGENAWEYYPYNGYWFLTELYEAFALHPDIRPRLLRDVVAEYEAAREHGEDPAATLPCLVAGSWVYGDLATWIGQPDKNRAWDLLVAAKRECDEAFASGRLDSPTRSAVSRQLGVCESSDWYWWFGDNHPAESVSSFDRLFRASLSRVYELIGRPAPAALRAPVSIGSASAAHQGAILRSSTEGLERPGE